MSLTNNFSLEKLWLSRVERSRLPITTSKSMLILLFLAMITPPVLSAGDISSSWYHA